MGRKQAAKLKVKMNQAYIKLIGRERRYFGL